MIDEYRVPCPNGCLDKSPDTAGPDRDKAHYCNVNGCDMESPGLAYAPDLED